MANEPAHGPHSVQGSRQEPAQQTTLTRTQGVGPGSWGVGQGADGPTGPVCSRLAWKLPTAQMFLQSRLAPTGRGTRADCTLPFSQKTCLYPGSWCSEARDPYYLVIIIIGVLLMNNAVLVLGV